ncbi:unnamed protein product, partial [Effrenium voratum]
GGRQRAAPAQGGGGAACGEATRGGHGAHAQPPHHSPRLEAGEYFDLLQAGASTPQILRGADHGLRLLLHLRERELLRQGGGGDAALHGAGASARGAPRRRGGLLEPGRGPLCDAQRLLPLAGHGFKFLDIPGQRGLSSLIRRGQGPHLPSSALWSLRASQQLRRPCLDYGL